MKKLLETVIGAVLFAWITCSAGAPHVTAQEANSKESPDSEDSTPTDEHSKARKELMVQAMEKYSVIVDGNTDKPATLESSTLLRYSNPLGDVADGEIIDAALFTYVVATDPEACLLIEIHRKGDVTSWEYMVLPMTIYSLDAKLDGISVWMKPEAIVFGDPVAPFYTSSYRGDPGEATFRALLPKQ